MPVRVRAQRPPADPLPVYRRARAADLPTAMSSGGSREHVPLTFFAREWAAWPDERVAMIREAPQGCNEDDLCRIAAVVHALCDRDGIAVPDWVWRHRSEVDLAWGRHCAMDGFIWDQTVANAPSACAFHRVWFDHQFIGAGPSRRADSRRRVT